MTPAISLIVPAFNCETTLARAVKSGLAQSCLREIIIVDDCSTDKTYRLALELAENDPTICVFQTQRNGGAGVARNLGASKATGSHLCFLDSDDELIGDFFLEALSTLKAAPQILAIKSDQLYFDPVIGNILPTTDPRYTSAVLSSSVGMVLKQEVFERIGGFPEDEAFRGPLGGEDVAFMQLLIKNFQPIARLERPAYKVWCNTNSHVRKFLANTRLTENGFEFISHHPDQQPDSALNRALERYISADFRGPLTAE